MRRIKSVLSVLGVSALAAHGAVVTYSLSGTTDGGLLVVSGSFSFDTAIIGANFSPLNDNALPYLTTFSLAISGIPGTPTSTTFAKGVDATTYFLMQTDGDGEITNFSPGFDTPNADGYTLAPAGVNVSVLEDQAFTVSEAISWNYTQVPEFSTTVMGVGLGLLGFAGVRSLRACLKNRMGPVFTKRAGWRGATREHTRQRSVTEEQRSQPDLFVRTLRATGLFGEAFVGSTVTARFGDAPVSPPRPRQKSLVAGPIPFFRQALRRH